MMEQLVYPDSLGDTIDAINTALFERAPLPALTWAAAASWLADRQGLPGAYADMFTPTHLDYALGMLTFTGEPVTSRAAIGHVLGEEACAALTRLAVDSEDMRRALDTLGADPAEVRAALARANQGMDRRIHASQSEPGWMGIYCCGTCTAALWRRLNAQTAQQGADTLDQGLAALRHQRDGVGRWKRFPWYYTVLALAEMPHPQARAELRYASALIERTLHRLTRAVGSLDNSTQADSSPFETKYHRRRRILLQRVLENLV